MCHQRSTCLTVFPVVFIPIGTISWSYVLKKHRFCSGCRTVRNARVCQVEGQLQDESLLYQECVRQHGGSRVYISIKLLWKGHVQPAFERASRAVLFTRKKQSQLIWTSFMFHHRTLHSNDASMCFTRLELQSCFRYLRLWQASMEKLWKYAISLRRLHPGSWVCPTLPWTRKHAVPSCFSVTEAVVAYGYPIWLNDRPGFFHRPSPIKIGYTEYDH